MANLNIAGAPPWLIPALIVHLAMALVLLIPAMSAFRKAGSGALNALWLFLPVLGLFAVAILMLLRVMPVAGKPRFLALLVIVPLANIVFLWLFAFGNWREGGQAKPKRERGRRRTKPEAGAERAAPTLTGAAADQTSRPGMVEPTLHAGAAGLDAGLPSTPAKGAGADVASDMTLQAVASPSPSGAAAGAAADAGDRTIVAGNAVSTQAPEADPAPKGRTKVAARAEETDTSPPVERDQGYDLVGADVDDVYDEDGEPLLAVSAEDDQRAEAPAAASQKQQIAVDRDQGEDGKDVDEERALRGKGITEDDLALAQGVLDDLQQNPAAAQSAQDTGKQDPTESPMLSQLPLTDVAPNRVWLVQGVNARAANIEASIREEDVSRSVTGILVGRSNRADFIIDDESVSRNHARFVYLDGALHVEDLDSMNGTWVDGEKLEANDPQPVRRSSDVEFGKIRLDIREIDPD